MKRITDYKALTFDCYGTLIDWETGLWDAMQPLLLHCGRVDLSREEILNLYGQLELAQEQRTPTMRYPDILTEVHRAVAKELGGTSPVDLEEPFAQSVAHWPAFADAAEALRRLKKHFRLVILSNIDRQSFAASNRKLGMEFDAIYTAEDIGSYKPSDANFDYLKEHIQRDLGIAQHEILHTAQSLTHDHVPARKHGLANAWIDRQRLSQGGTWGATAKVEKRPEVDFTFFSLGEMADQLPD